MFYEETELAYFYCKGKWNHRPFIIEINIIRWAEFPKFM